MYIQSLVTNIWTHKKLFTSNATITVAVSKHNKHEKLYENNFCFWTLRRPGALGDFRKKNTKTHVALHENFSSPVSATDPVKISKDVASLVACTQKKIFCLGVWIYCQWRHKWRTFRQPWPTLPGPGLKPLDGSISLKFLLETRLQSESFDTLDDLLRFQVQKLW